MTQDTMDRSLRLGAGAAPFAAIALACIWLAFTAAARPLALPDEGRYVGVAWEMLRSGNWLVPTLDGLPYFQKPPLFYWITASGLLAFGKHEYSARLAPLLGAALAAGSLHWFARHWWSDRGAAKTVFVLATMPMLFAAAQFANMDMLVAGCITATILVLAHACLLDDPDNCRPARLAGFAFAALGILAKGLIGIALPAMVLVLWALAARRPRRLLALAWLPGWLLLLLIAAPWFLLMQARFPQFMHYFFVVQHFHRYTQPSFNNPQPMWFYPGVLAVLCLPWTAWLLAGPRPRQDPATGEVRLLMWAWLLSIVLFFSIPRSKLLGYILPALPPLAFLIAQRWTWRDDGAGQARRVLAGLTAVLAASSCLVVVGAAAHLSLKSTKPLATALSGHGTDQVVFLKAYYFDLPFYADLGAPVTVLDDWDLHRRSPGDDWHQELWEAAAFDPVRGESLLGSTQALDHANCPGATSWVVGDSRLADKYPLLSGLTAAADNEGVSVWRVQDWVADPQGSTCTVTRPGPRALPDEQR